LAAMVLFLVATTVLLEWLSVDVWRRWDYARSMPTLPLTGTGLAPLLQWLLLPPLAIWLARRHLGGRIAAVRPSDRVP
ncbi:MAG: hypothetical protein KY397_06260, partial [Gemmatimonadetes bacterium]|nr:hypothetical protein [Gemmatimonadota bacterium]